MQQDHVISLVILWVNMKAVWEEKVMVFPVRKCLLLMYGHKYLLIDYSSPNHLYYDLMSNVMICHVITQLG